MSPFKKVTVFGAGVMGHSLALLHAQAAEAVCLVDTSPSALQAAAPLMRNALETLDAAGELKESPAQIMERISFHEYAEDCLSDTELVIEAISENPDIKRRFFAGLPSCAAEGTPGASALVASNTSTLDIFALAPESLHPRLFAAHHFVPPHIIPLVEIIGSPAAGAGDLERLQRHYRAAGAVPVPLKKFTPGFVVNRLQFAIHQEMFKLMEEGVVDAAELDLAVKASLGIRIAALGIVKRLDFAGLDLVLGNMRRLGCERLPAQLRTLVEEGHTGIKAGQGFYDYGQRTVEDICRKRDDDMLRIRSVLRELGLLAREGEA